MGYPHKVGTRVVFGPKMYGRRYRGVVIGITENPNGEGETVSVEYHRFFGDTPDGNHVKVHTWIHNPSNGYYSYWEADLADNPLEVY